MRYRSVCDNSRFVVFGYSSEQKVFGIRFVKTCYFLPVVINRIAICLMFTFIILPGQGPVPVLLKGTGDRRTF